jgi:hypothetical protein
VKHFSHLAFIFFFFYFSLFFLVFFLQFKDIFNMIIIIMTAKSHYLDDISLIFFHLKKKKKYFRKVFFCRSNGQLSSTYSHIMSSVNNANYNEIKSKFIIWINIPFNYFVVCCPCLGEEKKTFNFNLNTEIFIIIFFSLKM